MKKYLLMTIGLLLALPALVQAGPPVGSPAPNFTIPDTAGVNHSLSEYRGKVVQLFFWTST